MLKTPLYDRHRAQDARMGPFAGYDMPLFYPGGVVQEHLWTRENAGLFDVSHMGQIILSGDGVAEWLETLTPSAIRTLAIGQARYTTLLNGSGGIIDDLIITRLEAHRFFAVINAGCKEKDIAFLQSQLGDGITLERLDHRALLALQGPQSENVLRKVLGIDLSGLGYMRMHSGDPLMIARLGYTGEDGFEISVPAGQATDLWGRLLSDARVRPVGLAARDSLRLEMGYPLYGHDIDEGTTPIEADLGWIVRKNNPPPCAQPMRKRVGIALRESGIAREGAPVYVHSQSIGVLCSGGHSPVLKGGIAMAYLPIEYANAGQPLTVEVRGRHLSAVVTPLPFIPPKTRGAKPDAASTNQSKE